MADNSGQPTDPPVNPAEPGGATSPANPSEDPSKGGEKAPAVTPSDKKGGGAATSDTDETVTIPKKDYNNLIGQRDRANESNQGKDAFLEQLAQERTTEQFLSDNKEKYPDLTKDDLSHVWDPDQLETEAKRVQQRLEGHAQAKLADLENDSTPPMPAAEKAQKLDEMRNKGQNNFGRMLDLRMSN